MFPSNRGLLYVALAVGALALGGCTSPREYLRNRFKVGPEYATPPAPVAEDWIDGNDVRLHEQTDDLSTWWAVFDDPTLNDLMVDAYQQNLTLREAGFRILAARAQLGIAFGNFFPQSQTMNGSYQRAVLQQIYSQQWTYGFNMAWELDFWGRFRRAIISADASLDASIFNYDDILVTLVGDVASNYVQIRTTQRRIQLLENVIKVQQDVYNFISERLKAGFRGVTDLDKAQAESDLRQSQAQVEQLQIDLRQTENRLCTLLGIPAVALGPRLNAGPKTGIPIPPDYAVVGVPADLLRRRPDVRRAERLAAAQAEQIGIATAELYPAFTITGSIGWQNANLANLIEPGSFIGAVGPSFQWNVLNYGRLVNNIRLQDATFNALVTSYQNTVVDASAEVENGIVTFLRAQRREDLLNQSVGAAYRALAVIVGQYEAGVGGVDFNRYAVILQSLIQQQDTWAQSQGQIGQGLIQIYRGLGGGWQIRLNGNVDDLRALPPVDAPDAEIIAPPVPEPDRPVPQKKTSSDRKASEELPLSPQGTEAD